MLFSHDTEHSLACAVDLVNSAPVDGADDGLPTWTRSPTSCTATTSARLGR